ncbi:MAG: hypothetical protein ACRED5_10275 [Propylenella sp.]
MLRFVARFVGFWLVAAALVAAVVDGAKSIAASSLVMTPLIETWTIVATFFGWEELAEATPPSAPWPLDVFLAWLFAAPTVALLAVIGVSLLLLGARRRRPSLSREFAA